MDSMQKEEKRLVNELAIVNRVDPFCVDEMSWVIDNSWRLAVSGDTAVG